MPLVNGERIRQARELARLTQNELAAAGGVAQTTIGRLESGAGQPGPATLERLAEALDFPASFFHRPLAEEMPLGSLLMRAQRAMRKKDLKAVQREAELVCEVSLALAERLDWQLVAVPDLSADNPMTAALKARAFLGLSPDRPIPNLTFAVERAAVLVLALPSELPGWDAFSTRVYTERGVVCVIATSANVPGDRRRFSVAHELGHLLMHRSHRGFGKDAEGDANRFASELLAPTAVISDEFTLPVTLESLGPLKSRWGMSIASLIIKACDVGRISERRKRRLFQTLSARGWRKREPAALDLKLEKPRAFARMAELLYGEPVRVTDLARDFSLSPWRVRRMLECHATRGDLVEVVSDNRARPTASNITRLFDS